MIDIVLPPILRCDKYFNKFFIHFIIISVTSLVISTALPPVIKIGAIFSEEQKDSSIEVAFKYAVYKINKDKNILPKTTLVYDIQYVPKDDSFRSSKKACLQVEFGIQAIFGPNDPLLGSHIQSICEALDIPHIEARLDFDTAPKEFSINLHPAQKFMNNAYKDLIIYLNWTKVAIIYEDDFGLFKQQELMKSASQTRAEMYIRQAVPETYRQVLKEIRQKEIYKLIIDTKPEHIQKLFRAILQLQMNDYRYHYMFTTFDIETFDLEDFKYNNVNITAFRLVDIQNPNVADVVEQMKKFQPNNGQSTSDVGLKILQTEPALMYDSVAVFAAGLQSLDRSHKLKPVNLSCEQETPWEDGTSLYNYLNSASINGLTGHIEFEEGKRNNFKIDLLKLKKEHLLKVGEWTPNDGINITDPQAFYETTVTNITLIVMTREEVPYVMVKEDKNLTGNARFEGFCIDLLHGIAKQIGFQYTIKLVPDRMYGVFDPETKQWNGIVRELIERRADLAVASMTINYARESVIDFTKPFMNLGIGILFKEPKRVKNHLFSFARPFSSEIWVFVAFSYVCVSLTMWMVARFSPFEWELSSPNKIRELYVTDCGCLDTTHDNALIVDPNECSFDTKELSEFQDRSETTCGHNYNNSTFTLAICNDENCVSKHNAEEYFNSHMYRNSYYMKNFRDGNMEDDDDELITMEENDDLSNTIISEELNNMQHSVTTTMPLAPPSRSHDILLDEVHRHISCYDHHDDVDAMTDDSISSNEIELTTFHNDFTLYNSFWYMIGTLMQGSDLHPKATSTRIVGGIWWFFTLIIISSYTANLAAFLTVERMITPIENAADLADQTEIVYGTLSGGSTMTFFRDSKIGIYQKMWRFMESRKPSVFVQTYEEGIRRVLEGNYAFLMESTMLDYAVQRDCNLTQIGGLLDSKGYGIATSKGSQWRDKISLAILELQEKGMIQILYDKYWKNTGDVCNRDDKSKENKANALGVDNIGGVFVVLLCGLAFAILVAILEFCWNSKKNAQTERQSLCSEMANELRFAVKCHGSRQRPALKRSCAKCNPNTTYVPGTLSHLNGEIFQEMQMVDLKKYGTET
uniref:CSON010117 protein n=1 Tax=Culicoides sonorensis TaxID=179676 RepID=A0A336LKS7_CULSO